MKLKNILGLNLAVIFSMSSFADDIPEGYNRAEARAAYFASLQPASAEVLAARADIYANPTYLPNGAQDNASMREQLAMVDIAAGLADPNYQANLDKAHSNALIPYAGKPGRVMAASEIPNFDANGNYDIPGFGPAQTPLTQKQMDLFNAARASGHAPSNASDYLTMLGIADAGTNSVSSRVTTQRVKDILQANGGGGQVASNVSAVREAAKKPAPISLKTPASSLVPNNLSNVDYIVLTKDSSVNALGEATKKFEQGLITKDEFNSIALQVGRTVNYSNGATSGQSGVIKTGLTTPGQTPSQPIPTIAVNQMSASDKASRGESIQDIYKAYGLGLDSGKLNDLINSSLSLSDISKNVASHNR